MNLITLLGLAIVLFASTNFDDIFFLIGFFADPRFRARNVAIGQYVGIGAIVAVSLGVALISLVLPPAYIGLLGAVPILLGVKKLLDLRHGNGDDEETRPHKARGGAFGQIASVAAVTIANCGDNIGVYTPLFATQSAFEIAVIVIVFTVMTGLWLALAHWLVNHRTIGAPIRRYGHLAVPFALIGVGVFILCAAGSFELLRFLVLHMS